MTDSPTLGEMRQRMVEQRHEARLRLEELSSKKPQQKRHVRTWHRLNGASMPWRTRLHPHMPQPLRPPSR